MKCVIAIVALTSILAASAPAQAVTATTHVVISGGPKAGTYDTQTARAGCTMGVAGKGIFGVQISDSKGAADKFNAVQVSVANPSSAGSTEFTLVVGFGPVMTRTIEYTIETRPTERKLSGKGRVSVTGADGSTPTVNFDATTAEGIHLVGTVNCKSVMRM